MANSSDGGALLDEVVIECAKTGEQGVFVVNCHGGALAARRVMDALAAEGARPAGNKEFLARQRRIGLLDRIQEEAAERIPRAPTLRAVQVLLDQYDGALSRALDELRRRTGSRAGWTRIAARLRQFLSTATFGRGLARPPRLVIAGRPNVGKSTLANALLRDDRMHRPPGAGHHARHDRRAPQHPRPAVHARGHRRTPRRPRRDRARGSPQGRAGAPARGHRPPRLRRLHAAPGRGPPHPRCRLRESRSAQSAARGGCRS